MAQTPTPGNHSFQNYDGWARYKTAATTTWGSTATVCTITDPKVATNSFVEINVTGSTPPNGRWAIAVTSGQIVVTSTDAESSTLPLAYIIL